MSTSSTMTKYSVLRVTSVASFWGNLLRKRNVQQNWTNGSEKGTSDDIKSPFGIFVTKVRAWRRRNKVRGRGSRGGRTRGCKRVLVWGADRKVLSLVDR